MSMQLNNAYHGWGKTTRDKIGVCPHGYDIIEVDDYWDQPGFRDHDRWNECECPECKDKV